VRGEATRDFNTLFNTFYVRLARLLYRITGDFGRAEEMASEAFWRLYRKPPVVTTNIEGWLYRTGLRLALDQIKKERRRARYEGLGAVFGLAASPEQELERIEERTRLRQALSALKEDQVALILLRGKGSHMLNSLPSFTSTQPRSALCCPGPKKPFERNT